VYSGVVLEKVCEYLYYNQKHAESKDVSDMDIPPELCLELLIAADYLDGREGVQWKWTCADDGSLSRGPDWYAIGRYAPRGLGTS
jgi:hypothetical protein